MKRKQEEELKKDILSSAKGLFAKFGPKKTTVDEIALNARVGKGTVYYYFENKENIFLKVIEEEIEELLERVKKTISEYESPILKLQAFFVERMKGLSELLNLRWVRLYPESVRWESLERENQRLKNMELALVEGILEEGKMRGFFTFDDAKKIAQNIVNILFSLDRTFSEELSLNEIKRKIEDILGILIDGLRSREDGPERGTH